MEKIYRAAKYIRTSCPDDELQCGDSVANQRKLMDRFLLNHLEIEIVAEKIDNGYSGVFFNRPAFKEMIADIEIGHIDYVIVKDLSRLGRNYVETGKLLRDFFQAKNIRFISVDDNLDSVLMDEFDKTIFMIKSIFSEQYSRDVSIKIRSSLDIQRKQGKYVGAVPIYGYQKSDDDKHRLAIDPNTYITVQDIFNMKLQGMSAVGIAAELNNSAVLSPIAYKRKEGLPHPTGGYADKNNARWSATTILRILRDENYTGTLVQGRQRKYNYKSETPLTLCEGEWIKVENAHPPIVSKADYDAVQRVIALDTRTPSKQSEVRLFSGLLICGCCYSNMTRKTCRKNGRQYIYYYCPTGKSRGCRLSFMVSESALVHMVTQKVWTYIKRIQKLSQNISETDIENLAERVRSQQIALCNQKIQDAQNFKAHLHRNLACGFIDNAEFLSFQDYYDGEIVRLNEEIIVLQKKLYEGMFENEFLWMGIFLQFIDMTELDRLAVVKMIQRIHVKSKSDIAVDFVCQHEYEQAKQYLDRGGYSDG
jgi:DNA invertase Pin-like site-specific DNA recombinase